MMSEQKKTPFALFSSLSHPEFDFKLLRQLGVGFYGGSTIGECLALALTPGEWNSAALVNEYARLGEEVMKMGESSFDRGHRVSAREAWLRAANYYQTAEYFACIANMDMQHYGRKCEQVFSRALPLLPWGSEIVDIPSGNLLFPGYLFLPRSGSGNGQTVLLIPGIESSGEEQYFFHAVSALERGYRVLILQGCGQAGMLRRRPDSYLRRDFDVPIMAAIDFLEEKKLLNSGVVALVGSGLGGQFAARAAAADQRVSAIVVNPPYTDLYEAYLPMIGRHALNVDVNIDMLDEIPDAMMTPESKLFIINLCRRLGLNRLQELLSAMREFNLDGLLEHITCPVLSISSEDAHEQHRLQAERFHCGVASHSSVLYMIPSLFGTDMHDNVGNLAVLNQVVFDWLDETLD